MDVKVAASRMASSTTNCNRHPQLLPAPAWPRLRCAPKQLSMHNSQAVAARECGRCLRLPNYRHPPKPSPPRAQADVASESLPTTVEFAEPKATTGREGEEQRERRRPAGKASGKDGGEGGEWGQSGIS